MPKPQMKLAARPMPAMPTSLTATMIPAPELAKWLRETFIDPGAPLQNVDHEHLQFATIACLWAWEQNTRQMKRVIGMAEQLSPRGNKWSRARAEQQMVEWFGSVPDFLITIDAAWALTATDVEFCAVLEHEAYHCGHERNEYGALQFTKAGAPKFGMLEHDVTEFVGVVRRYGMVGAGVREMVEAAIQKPMLKGSDIAHVCGTCNRAAA